MKRCKRCRKWKETDDYYKNNGNRISIDGLRTTCIACMKRQASLRAHKGSRAANAKNKDLSSFEPVVGQRCSTCRIQKPFSAFSRDHTRASGYLYQCRECNAESQRLRRAAAKQKRRKTRGEVALPKIPSPKLNWKQLGELDQRQTRRKLREALTQGKSEIAPTTRLEKIDSWLLDDFMKRIFSFEPGDVLLNDQRELWHFGLEDKNDIEVKIKGAYGITVSATDKLVDILERLETICGKRRSG